PQTKAFHIKVIKITKYHSTNHNQSLLSKAVRHIMRAITLVYGIVLTAAIFMVETATSQKVEPRRDDTVMNIQI
ncbi:hypothetical protein DOY81_011515, partial [Sarcophaga bullata]